MLLSLIDIYVIKVFISILLILLINTFIGYLFITNLFIKSDAHI